MDADRPADPYAGPYAGQYEDGNALAGALGEIFAVDTTTAAGRCTGCGSAWPLARLHVYAHAPGFVGRCPDCEQVILRLVRSPDTVWLDLRGTVSVAFPMNGG
ncbi:hypothetical protein ITX44_17830 [Streptomyces sp. KK5PA1]|uniref:Uncharacterized protein n=1 Tax=Actinacidiphila acididurans TaxID=2784346 RepID=A0ABS2TSR6_9ACTN|nr:hypothetical protein [Actinacidiphila acididurans]